MDAKHTQEQDWSRWMTYINQKAIKQVSGGMGSVLGEGDKDKKSENSVRTVSFPSH